MAVSVTAPFGPAYQRMKSQLFRPFDMTRWIYLGFLAWISQFAGGASVRSTQYNPSDWFGGSGSSSGSKEQPGGGDWWGELGNALGGLGPATWGAIIAGGLAVLGLGLVYLYISSRGHFMFLDNVVRNRMEVKETWRDFRDEGRSYFQWNVAFTAIVLVLGGALGIVFGVGVLRWIVSDAGNAAEVLRFLPAIQPTQTMIAGAALFVFLLGTGFLHILLHDLLPILMWKDRTNATVGWSSLWELVRGQPGTFALYALFRILLQIGSQVMVAMAVMVTCCVALIPLIIPVVGTIVTLPIPVFFRHFSIAFLAQFGRKYDAFDLIGEPVMQPDVPVHFQAEPGEDTGRDDDNPYSPLR